MSVLNYPFKPTVASKCKLILYKY